MPNAVAVLNVVGLSSSLLPYAPRISALGGHATLTPVLPAVTCSVQSSMLTGLPVSGHGVVGNGWFNHKQQEVQFWKQSNKLVDGEKVWETAKKRDASSTCLNMFWWYNMYSTADWSVTPRPQYKADGRKIPDCYSHPADLRDVLQAKLGRFPLFKFWGPMADIESTRWIAEATKLAHAKYGPTLTLCYLPHLDYGLQKLGPSHADIPKHVAEVDAVVGDLIDYFQGRDTRVIVVSEYGIEDCVPGDGGIAVNRFLREAGLLATRLEGDSELLDAGASRAFAVVDHQVAHVYHGADTALPDIPHCTATGLEHERAGRTVLVADPGYWFTYDYWLTDARKPDFAHTVDIHRKPGYDPRELFSDKAMPAIAWKLLKKKLGFRQLMDVIPLDTALVRGTHGRVDNPPELQPVLIGAGRAGETLPCTAVRDVVLGAMFD
ncbi:MAG: nucleotide pyrophosphatase/phosphodiesterase family protein [Phycisphaerales bacterium JB063]